MGAKAKVVGAKPARGAVSGFARTARAQKELGFKAKVDLATGLRQYANWYAHMRPTVRMVK